jgi:hypothetical protein
MESSEGRLNGLQPSLAGLVLIRFGYPGLPSWANFSRPFGTLYKVLAQTT